MNFFSTKTPFWHQLSLMLCLLTSAPATAEKIPNYNLASPIQFASISRLQWADSSHSATPTQAKVKLSDSKIMTGHFMVPLEKASHWFAFTLTNTTDEALTPSIFIDKAYAHQVNLHYQQQGQWISRFSGTDVAIHQRQVNTLIPVFNVALEASQSQTFYLEMHSKIKLLPFNISLGEAKDSTSVGDVHFTLVNIFIGAGLLISLINVLMYLSFKQRVYIYYSAYILSFIGATFVINSFDQFFNWPIKDRSFLFLTYHSMIIFISLFISEVLNTKLEMPKIDLILRVCRWLAVIMALATLFDGNYFSYTIVAFVPVSAFFLGILIYASVAGKANANLLAIGIATFLSGIICVQLVNLGLIASNVLTEHGALIGALAEMVMFSLALFRRMINLNTEISEANAKWVKMAQDAQALLEKTVTQRTLELHEAKVQAEQANEARGHFLTTISHEVRTPLNGILGMIEVLQKSVLPSTAQAHLATLDGASQQLTSLVNNVLDFSKIDQGMLQLNITQFDLPALIEQVKKSFEHQALTQSIDLSVSFGSNVAQYWQGDENRLRQILLNLMSNAIKFTRQGRVDLEVTMDLTAANTAPLNNAKKLLFRVTDTGIGITTKELNSVFDAYHQVSQRQQKHSPGTGLGLAISQQLAHAMGGHISVTSELHQGSQFDLNVILEQSKVPQEPTQFNTQNPIEFPQLSLNRILIVDDSDINLKVAQAYLQTTQAHLTLCNNGQQALKEFQAQPVDMVLIDLQMPELDGLEVCRQMRLIEQSLQRPKCGIILHTADSRPEIIVTATKAGVDYCLFKPYTQTQLLQAMGLSLAINRPDSGSGSGAESASETESGLILDSESEPNTPIRLANDPSLEALKGAFFQQTTTHLQQCVHHLETHAMSDFSALLHQLIGSTSLFGAHELHATLTQMNVIVNSLEESIALEAEDSLEVEDSLKVEDSLEVEDSGEDTDSLENQEKWAEHHTKTMNNRELERLMLLAQQQLKAYESHG